MILLRDPLQSHSRATNAQLIGEPLYFCKQTLTHASAFCSSCMPALPPNCPLFFLSLSIYSSSLASSSFSPLLPPSVPLSFSASVSSVSEDLLQAHCQAAIAKINNIILIQTDIKRHTASKANHFSVDLS